MRRSPRPRALVTIAPSAVDVRPLLAVDEVLLVEAVDRLPWMELRNLAQGLRLALAL